MSKYGLLVMSKVENSSYKDSACAKANIGDAIQTLTIRYLFEQMNISKENIIDVGIDELKYYHGEPIIMPIIGVLERNTVKKRFPCSPRIRPVFFSSLMYDDVLQGDIELVSYFKKYEPIGCRDERTRDIFRRYGIEAYMMGCISLATPKRENNPESGRTFLIDVPKSLEKYIPNDLKANSENLCHEIPLEVYPITEREYNRIERVAQDRIELYKKEANLVVTSRLHAAAPCIAMGIPVIVVSNNYDYRFAWLDKYVKLYTADEFSQIFWNPDAVNVEFIRERLYTIWNSIITCNMVSYRDILKKLDSYYSDRMRADYFSKFKRILRSLQLTKDSTYAIWGAGQHCDYIIMLMDEICPEAKLMIIFDKYKRGSINGVEIISSETASDYNFDFVFITTLPGMHEAAAKLEERGFKRDVNYFIMISKEESEVNEKID